MVDKLKAIEEKYIELENAMQQPEVYSDPAVYVDGVLVRHLYPQ